jgi:uncharacterized protein YyaL (SSP411 family)
MPHLVIAGGDPEWAEQPELLRGRGRVEGRATAYLCRSFTCQLPTSEKTELARQLEGYVDEQ